MAFLDKFRKKKAPPPTACEPKLNTMVMILFDRPTVPVEELEAEITKRFGAEAVGQPDNSHPAVPHLMLRVDGMEVLCSYLPFPLPPEEADIPALLEFNHFMTVEEQKAFLEHQSFCMLTQIGGGGTLQGKRDVCVLLSRLCGCLLNVQGAVGVYYSAARLLLGKGMYARYAAITEKEARNPDYFPPTLWILPYQTCTETGAAVIETCGLTEFGFLELGFYKPTEEWAQIFEKLYIMSLLQITEKELYRNMDTISFAEDTLSVFKQSGNKLYIIGDI